MASFQRIFCSTNAGVAIKTVMTKKVIHFFIFSTSLKSVDECGIPAGELQLEKIKRCSDSIAILKDVPLHQPIKPICIDPLFQQGSWSLDINLFQQEN